MSTGLTIGPRYIDAVGMRLQTLHSWDLTPTQAVALQTQLAPQVIRTGDPGDVSLVAAADIAFVERTRGWQGGLARAAVVLMSYPGLALVEQHVIEAPVAFPYVPGLLSFREIPALALAFDRLAAVPGLLLVDGQGVAHPRRFGLAAHLGLLAGVPTIGCAKSRLRGEAADPGPTRGSVSDLIDGDERIGLVVRTKDRVKPLYVSVGHLISLERAAEWVLRLAPTHRLPEPIRLADRLSKGLPIADSASAPV
jgi:deoxyribonuclease V